MGKFAIKFLTVGAIAAALSWMWSISTSDAPVALVLSNANADQPSGAVNPVADSLVGAGSTFDQAQSLELEQRFAQANKLLERGETQAAAEKYKALISDFPKFIEAYVNLAALQASVGNLQLARTTLLAGAESNQSTKVLFDSITKLHGVLAAQAYRNALESGAPKSNTEKSVAELPKVSTLSSGAMLSLASAKPTEANTQIIGLESHYKTESDLVAKLRSELQETKAILVSTQSESEQLAEQNEDLYRRLAVAQKNAALQAVSTADKAAAIGLIEAWAKAWSDQDVARYIGFYRLGYSPDLGLSHEQWVVQKKAQFGNQGFIKVAVRDFVVVPSDEGFIVTFTQHYRSNTLEDTTMKSMRFTLQSGADWGDAKISWEQAVRS